MKTAIGYQILARCYYKSSVHEIEMMNMVRDGRSKAKHRRAAIRYQKQSANAYEAANYWRIQKL